MNDFSVRPELRPDPYESVIEHYGEMRHAYWMEIGLGRDIGSWLRDSFNAASLDLAEASPKGYNNRVVSAELIIDTGNIPFVTSWGEFNRPFYATEETEEYWGSSRIDWDTDDAFTQAMNQLNESVIERVELSEMLLDLRALETWTREDRIAWEREIAEIVSEEVNKIPGFDEYRSIVEIPGYPVAEVMPAYLNELSEDMENDTVRIEFDCDTMSVVEAVLLQRIEEEYLPLRGQDEDDYKIRSNYFVANAEVNFGADSEPLQHAFILSSATGNIIEATSDPDFWGTPYIESANPNFSFEDFVRGDTFVGTNGSVYGGHIQPYLTARDTPAPETIQPLPQLPPLNPNGA